jgi:hypothetical protein
VTAAEALLENPAEFIRIGRFDWFVTKSWNRLHWAEIPNDRESQRGAGPGLQAGDSRLPGAPDGA